MLAVFALLGFLAAGREIFSDRCLVQLVGLGCTFVNPAYFHVEGPVGFCQCEDCVDELNLDLYHDRLATPWNYTDD